MESDVSKRNCWEAKGCGREPGGVNTDELGVCPAATAEVADGVHGGVNGGRSCWAIAGTLCQGRVQGSFALKISNCLLCEFYRAVLEEEGEDLLSTGQIIDLLLQHQSC